MSGYMSVREAATLIGASASTIQKRCKDGTIPSIRVGKHYKVLRSDIEKWASFTPQPVRVQKDAASQEARDLFELIESWLDYLGIQNKASTTISNYRTYLLTFLRRAELGGQRVGHPADLYSRGCLLAGFQKIGAKSHSLKLNTANALMSFGRFLTQEGLIDAAALVAIRDFRPTSAPEPRRTSLTSDDLPRLFHVIANRSGNVSENIALAAMVGCMVYAGLRVTEVCSLRTQDVYLRTRTLKVRHGKGGRDRSLGIRTQLLELVYAYCVIRPHYTLAAKAEFQDRLFLRCDGRPWDKDQLGRRMRHVARLIGLDITCHGLRRTFATIASRQGRSINAIRIALGHSDLMTTQAYLCQTENEVIAAMKEW